MSKKKRYPVRIPRHAAGIRAQELRASSGRSWWAKQWIEALESMSIAGRFARARTYALSGQVSSISMEGSRVSAQVVGGRPGSYHVEVSFRKPDEDAHARIVSALKAEPMLVARILTDDLPMEVESLFRAEGMSLFPGAKLGPGEYDTETSCLCPDWANPCKHAMAVLMLLGEECARRPATLLELRGITMEELCGED